LGSFGKITFFKLGDGLAKREGLKLGSFGKISFFQMGGLLKSGRDFGCGEHVF